MPERDRLGTRLANRLIRRVHVRTTHQALAMDALAKLSPPEAELWRRLLLRYGHAFAEGAAAPDTDFRDFKNHVLFPEAGWWGGAAIKAQAWHINLTNALKKNEWRNAAFCAGVLCHYLVDPLHPFHTGQSVAENDVHYAVDAAVWLDYDALATLGSAEFPSAVVNLDASPEFIAYALAAGSEAAHSSFDALLTHFDLERARKRPALGLDKAGRYLMADMIVHAAALFAATLDRAVAEADVPPPRVSLAFVSLRAALTIPFAALARRRQARKMRRQIRRMAEEQALYGQVQRHLPEEERVKRDTFMKDMAAQQATAAATTASMPPDAARVASSNILPFELKSVMEMRSDDRSSGDVYQIKRPRGVVEPARPAPRAVGGELSAFATRTTTADGGKAPAARILASPAVGTGHAAAAVLTSASTSGLSNFRDRRSMPVPDPATVAPRRFEQPASTAQADQAQLMKSIPGLTPQQAQLLSDAGYATINAIAEAGVEKFCADILSHALTKAGRRALRDASPPDIETVQKWVDVARAARAA